MSRAVFVLWLILVSMAAAGDWPQFLGPERNGSAPDETIVDRIPSAGLPIRWRRPAGEGYSGPAVVGSRVILFHQPAGEEVVECLSADTGKTLWKVGYPCRYQGGYGTGPGPRATPAVADGTVYTFGSTAVLQAVDLESGKVRWRRDLQAEYDVPEGFFGVGTSPLVDEGKLLVTVGAKKASLVAFDCLTGKNRWVASNDEASYASPLVASVGGKKKAFFFARTGLHVVDPTSGNEESFFRFRARMNASVNAATPIVVNDQVFLSAEYGTGAVLLNVDGKELVPVWQSQDALSNHYDTSIYHDGYLFGIDGRQEFGARLRCIEMESGDVQWTEEGFGCASLVKVGDRLLCVTEPGEIVLVALDAHSYQERGRQSIGESPTRAAPALSNGFLYIRTPTELISVDCRPQK